MPRVSILIATHNRADVVGLAVESALGQSETDVELLVVADGCTDDTVARITALGDPRIRLFDLPKAPYHGHANRNVALREAKGAFIAYAAHDDLLFPDHVERLIDRLESTGRDWVYSRPLRVSTDGTVVPYAINLTLADELDDFLTVRNTVPASCAVYRRSCLDRFGCWPERAPADGHWHHWRAIIEGGRRTNHAYLDVPTCLHFSGEPRTVRHANIDEVRTWLEIADAADWWPPILRPRIPRGVPEQQVFARLLRDGGSAWVEELRAAVSLVLDRVAWDDICKVRPRMQAGIEERRRLAEQVHTLEGMLTERREVARRLESQVAALDARVLGHEGERRESGRVVAEAAARAEEAARAGERARRELVRIQSDLETTRAELLASRQRLRQVLHSRSWRLTAPIRVLSRLASGWR